MENSKQADVKMLNERLKYANLRIRQLEIAIVASIGGDH